MSLIKLESTQKGETSARYGRHPARGFLARCPGAFAESVHTPEEVVGF
ncbi:MAG: hypothetical protein CM1200mP22_33470 [Dehalococcoidia bacterium]|nr:MAG: hypothetical protein CM1200mP22_33470 [Dehalococcoidia bacterium]